MSTLTSERTFILRALDNPLEPAKETTRLISCEIPILQSCPFLQHDRWQVIDSGRVIPPEQWATYYPAPDAEVLAYPVLHDFFSGLLKNPLLLAVGIALPFVGPSLLALGTLSAVGQGLAALTSLLAGGAPDARGLGDQSSSPTYGFDSVQNSTKVGAPIPVVYGTHRVGGQYIELYVKPEQAVADVVLPSTSLVTITDVTETLGEGDAAYQSFVKTTIAVTTGDPFPSTLKVGDVLLISQTYHTVYSIESSTSLTSLDGNHLDAGFHNLAYTVIDSTNTPASGDNNTLFALIALSEGPIEAITDIQINGQSIANYHDVTVETRLGTNDQTAISLFGDSTTTTFSADAAISETYLAYTTNGSNLTAFELNITFPQGLFSAGGDGSLQTASVSLVLQYKPHSSGTWLDMGTFTIADAKRSTLRRYIRKDGLAAGKYDIQVKRTTTESGSATLVDAVRRSEINEIVNDAYIYPNIALLGVKVRATDQLSGGTPTITALVQGRKPRVYTSTSAYTEVWSDNPAWVVLDMLIQPRYGFGQFFTTANVDLQSFLDWAAYCNELVPDASSGTEKRAICDVVFDAEGTTIWDAVNKICGLGLASPVKYGTYLRIKIERAASSVQAFTMSSIKENSFGYKFLSLKERANYFEVEYRDRDNDYDQAFVALEDPLLFTNSEQPRKKEIQTIGVTRTTHALRLARTYQLINRYITKTVSFEAGIGAIALEPGDVYTVSHDVPGWVNKLFRCTELERTDDLHLRITGLEYDSRIYDDSAVPANTSGTGQTGGSGGSGGSDPGGVPAQVTDLALSILNDGRNSVAVSFTVPIDPLFDHANIYKDVGGHQVLLGTSSTGSFLDHDETPGSTVVIRVVSVSSQNVQANILTAPAAAITIPLLQPALSLPDITGLRLMDEEGTDFFGSDVEFVWDPIPECCGVYRVAIYNADGVTLRREEVVKDAHFVYSRAKNERDGLTVPGQVPGLPPPSPPPSPPAPGPPPILYTGPSIIRQDSFESGSVASWWDKWGVTVTTERAHSGVYSVRWDGGFAGLMDRFPAALDEVWMSGYILYPANYVKGHYHRANTSIPWDPSFDTATPNLSSSQYVAVDDNPGIHLWRLFSSVGTPPNIAFNLDATSDGRLRVEHFPGATDGLEIPGPDTYTGFNFADHPEHWSYVEVHSKLNTPSVTDGMLEVWIDGSAVYSYGPYRPRGSYNTPYGIYEFISNLGGNQGLIDGIDKWPYQNRYYIDDVMVSTTRITR
jgi:hypothetical protein